MFVYAVFKYGNVLNHIFSYFLQNYGEINQIFLRTTLKHLLLKELQHFVLIQH